MKNTLVAIASAATLSLVVAGCGSDSGSSGSGSESSGGGIIAARTVGGAGLASGGTMVGRDGEGALE